MDHAFTTTAEAPPSDAFSNNTTTTQPPSSHRAGIFHPTRRSSLSPPQRPPEKPCSAQNRRLQLRNAGFRGALLPSRKITPPFTTWRSASGTSDQHFEKQNNDTASIDQSPNLSRPTTSHTRRSSILQEINNSVQRRYCHSPRPPAASLFGDPPSPDPSTHDFPLYSPAKCTGQLGPPIDLDTFNYSDPDMPAKSKGSSSWRSSPFNTFDRSKRRPHMTNRHADLETSKYIQHLEEQLAASLDQVESIDSSATNVQAAKLKALSAEHKILKQELLEWETKFEVRLKDELRNTIDKESQLRAKIRALERDVEIKESKIHEQQWEIEMANQKLQNMDAANSTNRSLERRIDVLTELLAQSPTRIEPSPGLHRVPETTSPQANGVYRTPRPRSMFSKIPLSPIRKALFQPLSANPPLDPTVHNDHATDHSYISSPQRTGHADDVDLMSLDSGVGDSCSPPSTRTLESQRSSMISHSSSNSSFWGTSFPLSPEVQGIFSNRPRRMRRFPPGSCALKPLILPAASPHVPAGQAHRHSFSGGPISPFHLRPTSAQDSPNSAWVEPDTLRALEGQSHRYQTFDEAINDHRISVGMAPLEIDLDDPSAKGLSRTFFDDVHPAASMGRSAFDIQEQNEPSKRMTPCTLEKELRQSSYNSSTRLGAQTNHKIDQDVTPVAMLNSRVARIRNNYPVPRNSISSLDGRQDTFYYIWANPVNLVRRIIANAWHSNWKRLGKLPWWFLGFFLGGQPRNQWLKNKHTCQLNYNDHNHAATTANSRNLVDSSSSGIRYRTSRVEETPTRRTTTIQPDDNTSALMCTPLRGCARNHSLLIPPKLPPDKPFELWSRFSFALVLAIGLAVRDGPASLMDECLLKGSCMIDDQRFLPIDSNESTRTPSPEASPPPEFSESPLSENQVEHEPENPPVRIPLLHPDIPPG
ncbi:hypothetical protein AJ78_03489 [Emergomyces pasteurianus Ep9510]|uniref:Uncharacterized protein n=1 Tax=Emergomyces pasteurianus Ep9510 TaxID=1447872 RepID=A0A1J9PIL2_9EURO|nr:hypothetical protein AJ78_03489 [Emergomyces pasteurianus Ep9510]